MGLSDDNWLGSLVPDSLIATAADGSVLHWNAGAETVYGFPASAAIGRNLDELLQTRHPFGLEHLANELARTGKWHGEIYRRTAEGGSIGVTARRARSGLSALPEVATVEWSRPIADANPQEIAAHRYTNLFNAMAASFWELDFAEVRRAIGELVGEGVEDIPGYLLTNPDWIDSVIPRVRVLDVNEKTLELFAIPDKAYALANPMDWAWPAESRTVFARSLIAALRRDDHFTTETVLLDRNGKSIDVLFTVCWPTDHKAHGSVLVGVIDLSETKRAFRALRESEQHYRDLFQSMPVPLLRIDLGLLNSWVEDLKASGTIDLASHLENNPQLTEEIVRLPVAVDANPEALALFNVADIEGLRGPVEWAWRDKPDTLRRSLIARLRGASEFSEETRINLVDGTVVDVLYVISFAQDRVDRGYNVIGLLDITERKTAEEELREAREQLSHAARVSMLGELTASIAHEVNQPLAAISALADASLRWLDRPAPDLEEVRSLAGNIASDARRASEIISRIRAMSVKQAGEREEIDLNQLVQESLFILRHDCEARHVLISPKLQLEMPRLSADRIQLQQVIVNLVVNAMQAMTGQPPNSRQIVVETRINPDGMLELAIEDTGPGIAAENMARLFDSFFTTKGDGMGLGLSVCRTIVEAHGGAIKAENRPRGARFTISLPRE